MPRRSSLEDRESKERLYQKIVEEKMTVREAEKAGRGRTRGRAKKSAEIERLENAFREKLGTQVELHFAKGKKGKLTVRLYSSEDLERIADLVGIDLAL